MAQMKPMTKSYSILFKHNNIQLTRWMVFNGVSAIKAILSLLGRKGICLSVYLFI